MISFLVVLAILAVVAAIIWSACAVALEMADELTDESPAESSWMRGWRSVDWAAPGLESLSYPSPNAIPQHPLVDQIWMSPTGPRAKIVLPEGVSGSHVDLAAVHRLEGLLPGAAPMAVVECDRRSVTFALESRDPLADVQRSSAHSGSASSSNGPDPVADRIAYMEALAKVRRDGGAQ